MSVQNPKHSPDVDGPVGRLQPKKSLAAKPADSASVNLWALVGAFRKCWLQSTVVGVLVAAMVVAVLWLALPLPKQLVRSVVFVSAKDPFLLQPRNDGFLFDMYQKSQVAAAKGRFVLNAAMKRPELVGTEKKEIANLSIIKEQVDPLQWLEKELVVDFSISPEHMRIGLRGDNTPEMIAIVNAVTHAYLEEIVEVDDRKGQVRLDSLKQALTKFEQRVQAKKTLLKEVIEMAGSGDAKLLLFKQQIALQQLASARSELADIRTRLRILQVKIGVASAKERSSEDLAMALYCFPPTANPATASVWLAVAGVLGRQRSQDADIPAAVRDKIEELIQTDPDFKKYLKRENDLIGLVASLRRVNPPGAPTGPLLANEEELISVRKTLDAKRTEARHKYLERFLRDAKIKPTSNLAQLLTERGYWLKLEEIVDKDVEQIAATDKSINKSNIEIESLRDELSRSESYTKKVGTEIDNLEIEQLAPRRIRALEDAVVAESAKHATRYAIIGFGGLAALFLTCLAFSWWEYRAHRVNSPSQLVLQTGMHLMGTLPDYTKVRQSTTTSLDRYESILSDSVDAVRTLLLFMSKMEGIRTILVTSAVAGEGKTFSACHLAASLARAGRKTLLLDCDIRNPAVHHVYDVPLVPGLSEVLRLESDIAAAIRPSQEDNLFILPAGQGDVLALRVLALKKTEEVFKELKELFEFIVVDSSPVLPVPDALVICQHTDAAVLSILRDVSQFPKVRAAYLRLGNLGIRILGAIFNGNKEETYSMYNYAMPTAPTPISTPVQTPQAPTP